MSLEQQENAKHVISLPIPDEFEWEGKGLEPAWFQDWARKKAEYVKKVAEQYGYLPDTIWYWKMDKIKEVFPLDEAKSQASQQGLQEHKNEG